MRILIDLTTVHPEGLIRFHGGSEYIQAVYRRLVEMHGSVRLSCCLNPKALRDERFSDELSSHGVDVLPVSGAADLQKHLDTGRYHKTFISSMWRYWALDFSKTRLVLVIHGLRQLEVPWDAQEWVYVAGFPDLLRAWTRRLMSGSFVRHENMKLRRILNVRSMETTVVVSSFHTKYSLLARFPAMPHRLVVCYCPQRTAVSVAGTGTGLHALSRGLGVEPGAYMLIVSCDRWVKNAYRAVMAADHVFSAFPALPQNVLLVGAHRKMQARILRQLSNPERFVFCGYLTSHELELLYEHAYALVYPSLNEGFGYPPLECMKYGVPAVCSCVSSIPEVCGDAVDYFDPYSIMEIEGRLLRILTDRTHYAATKENARIRSAEISAIQKRDLDALCELILTE